MHDRYGVLLKMAEKRWFDGFRLSPHLFNTEADIDRALATIRTELG
jgi:selenocysteine lyase/cysteine desulfurase